MSQNSDKCQGNIFKCIDLSAISPNPKDFNIEIYKEKEERKREFSLER